MLECMLELRSCYLQIKATQCRLNTCVETAHLHPGGRECLHMYYGMSDQSHVFAMQAQLQHQFDELSVAHTEALARVAQLEQAAAEALAEQEEERAGAAQHMEDLQAALEVGVALVAWRMSLVCLTCIMLTTTLHDDQIFTGFQHCVAVHTLQGLFVMCI